MIVLNHARFCQNLAKILLISLSCSPACRSPLFGTGGTENVVFTVISFYIVFLWKKCFFCKFRLWTSLVIKMQFSFANAVYTVYFYSAAAVLLWISRGNCDILVQKPVGLADLFSVLLCCVCTVPLFKFMLSVSCNPKSVSKPLTQQEVIFSSQNPLIQWEAETFGHL